MSAVTASVLTVEDEPIVRADLRLVLEDAGFSVCAGAGDGVEAIELAREHEPDVILLDLGLNRLNGVEATRRILAERDVPIVALTGRSRRLAEEALDAGAHSYVLKPSAEEEVVGKLIDALAAGESLTIRGAREESRRSLELLLGLLGYPREWALDLERHAFRQGRRLASRRARGAGAMRVLIAEDETINRLDLRGIPEKADFEVCGEARDGQEAIDLARELEPRPEAA